MSWVALDEFPIDKNLKDVHDLLLQHSIVHRFTEENGKQRLWIAEADRAQEVHDLVVSYLHHQETTKGIDGGSGVQGDNSSAIHPQGYQTYQARLTKAGGVFNPFHGLPITSVTIGLSVLGFLIVYLNLETAWIVMQFTTLEFIFDSGQYWRLLTPTVIHFGPLHVIFNCMWALVLGMRLEPFLGKANYFILLVVTALAGNIAQALSMSNNAPFGGLSGVVYGLFGCLFFLHWKWPIRNLALPQGIYVFMLLNLVLGFAGVIDLFIVGSIANWAHLGGLLAGAAFGLVFSQTHQYRG